MLSATPESYFQSYGVVLAVAIGGALLVGVALLAGRVVAPRRPIAAKLTTYECGVDPVGGGWSQTQIRYYLFGLLFVIFDVEAVFLFPWAVVFLNVDIAAVFKMFIFIVCVACGVASACLKVAPQRICHRRR